MVYSRYNPMNNDDQKLDDLSSDLFPNAGQRFPSHGFYNSQPRENLRPIETSETNDAEADEFCPECDAPLEVKEGTLGKYISCSRFPECKFTKPYAASNAVEEVRLDDATSNVADIKNIEEGTSLRSSEGFAGQAEEPGGFIEQAYEEPTESVEPEEAAALPPEPYFREPSFLPEESDSESQLSETETSLADEKSHDVMPEENTATVKNEPTHGAPAQSPLRGYAEPRQSTQSYQDMKSAYGKDRPLLLDHPVWLKKKEVTKSSQWVELKQKRLMDQRNALISPADKAASGYVMPSPEEVQETLKKLEEDVQRLQQNETDQRQTSVEPSKKPEAPTDDYDEFDDVLPDSFLDTLKQKSAE
jgi:ssDNA-binding Zn-finger/Zn-ribbon topoisomerase 1